MKQRTKLVTLLLILLIMILVSFDGKSTIHKEGNHLLIDVKLPDNVKQIEVLLKSSRNQVISKKSDISPFDPKKGNAKETSNIWYPVVDVKNESNMYGVALFHDQDIGKYSINGMYNKGLYPVEKKSTIPNDKLLYWENSICMEPEGILEEFYLAARFDVVGNRFKHTFELLSEIWSGNILIYSAEDESELLFNIKIDPEQPLTQANSLKGFDQDDLSKDRLIESLKAVLGFTLRSMDNSPYSPSKGNLNLFYDLDAKMYRRPHWIWSSGPSIKLLLESAKLPEINSQIPKRELNIAAMDIGKATQRFQSKDLEHPAYGVVTSRWKEIGNKLEQHAGFEEYYSVADALFLIGWGWIPLYEETGDESFLENSQLLLKSTENLLNEFEIIPMDYIESDRKWKNYTINEAGFGTEGIAEVFAISKKTSTRALGDLYMDRLLNRFQRTDGLWARAYNFDTMEAAPTIYHTRGQGWAMEGLLASARMSENKKYKDLAINMAEVMMKYQNKSGYWSYIFTESSDNVGISEKGTALWSLLFYRLHSITKDPNHLITARKALRWCINNQYTGNDPEAYGSIVGTSPQSGVTYRPWFRLSCTYTTGFYGLAILEELQLNALSK